MMSLIRYYLDSFRIKKNFYKIDMSYFECRDPLEITILEVIRDVQIVFTSIWSIAMLFWKRFFYFLMIKNDIDPSMLRNISFVAHFFIDFSLFIWSNEHHDVQIKLIFQWIQSSCYTMSNIVNYLLCFI